MSVFERVERNMFKWFGYDEKIREDRLGKKKCRAIIGDNRKRGKPQRRWRDEVKELMMGRGRE